MIEIMKAHRSIRRFEKEPIPSEVVEEVFAAAQLASTSTHMQPYSVIAITDPEKRKAFRSLTGDQRWVEEAPAFYIFVADLHRIEKITVAAGEPFQGGYVESLLTAAVDTALFAQNVLLAFESKGYGGVYIGGIRNNPEQVATLLHLPKQTFAIFGMCVGKPAQDPEIKPRLPLPTVLFEERYYEPDLDQIARYDETVSGYYERRSKGRDDRSYSQNMVAKFSDELRPHMWAFLKRQGLLER